MQHTHTHTQTEKQANEIELQSFPTFFIGQANNDNGNGNSGNSNSNNNDKARCKPTLLTTMANILCMKFQAQISHCRVVNTGRQTHCAQLMVGVANSIAES